MKRSYIYIIVVVLTITLVTADYIMGKDLQKIIPVDEQYRPAEIKEPEVKLATVSGKINIKNEQNSDESIIYDYTLTIDGIQGAYRYKSNDIEGYLIFAANGQATFKLRSNETIEIYDIPVDSDFAIEQVTTRADYITKVNQREGNSFSSKIDEENNIVFNNAPKHGGKGSSKQEEPKKEEPKEEEPAKEEQPTEEPAPEQPDPSDIPNTGTREVLTVLILITAILIGFCFKKIRVRKYE